MKKNIKKKTKLSIKNKKIPEIISNPKSTNYIRVLPSTFKKILANILDPKPTIHLLNGHEFSEYDAYDDFLLIKFIKKERIDSVIAGSIYFPLVSTFWEDSNNSDVDINEGKLVFTKNYNKTSIFANGRTKDTIQDVDQTSYDILNAGNIPVCCFAEAKLDSSDLILLANNSSYSATYKFSDTFIKDLIPIRDNRPFIICSYKDLVAKFYEEGISINSTVGGGILTSGSITYLDYFDTISNFSSNISLEELLVNKYVLLFRKDIEYKNQHECRFVFLLNNRKEEPITIKTNSLINITNKYDSDFKLEDLKFSYDKNKKKFKVIKSDTNY